MRFSTISVSLLSLLASSTVAQPVSSRSIDCSQASQDIAGYEQQLAKVTDASPAQIQNVQDMINEAKSQLAAKCGRAMKRQGPFVSAFMLWNCNIANIHVKFRALHLQNLVSGNFSLYNHSADPIPGAGPLNEIHAITGAAPQQSAQPTRLTSSKSQRIRAMKGGMQDELYVFGLGESP
ncbi:hypothetical protein BO71DRAFT_481262 [Aspergillus ellipticus CBS 707.79]|uniref:Uncharacterized protein n=1 Tax=Aspergillus ellipticus CBS 707.79 TaxID=1448320 RepID=A0A319DIP1_9EURO|nr:hypothetical protein BO71DRAFT_481262 [Aspergillus ellipticus CBS 707.79]